MSFENMRDVSLPRVNLTVEAMQHLLSDEVTEMAAEQLASKVSFQASLEEAVNPFARLQRIHKDIKTHKGRIQKMLQTGEKSARLAPIEQIKDNAHQFQQRNPELKATILIMLRELIKPGDSKEEIIKKVQQFYQDVSLADEALEFLLETTDGELAKTVEEARQDFKTKHGRDITAGRNIGAEAREAAEKGLGSPTGLRDFYRSLTGNPRDAGTLFDELSQKYAFRELKKVTNFLLHSLGSDLKSKGPSIPPGLLHNLITETRTLQAILGVFRFFNNRMALMDKQFAKEGLKKPEQLTFELMAKQFMSLAGERYPSAEKVTQLSVKLGIEKWILAKIIAFSQFRDAVREVAVHQIYRSIQHRDELYLAILEALEDLEDELEELLERQERDEEDEEEQHEETEAETDAEDENNVIEEYSENGEVEEKET